MTQIRIVQAPQVLDPSLESACYACDVEKAHYRVELECAMEQISGEVHVFKREVKLCKVCFRVIKLMDFVETFAEQARNWAKHDLACRLERLENRVSKS